MSLRRSSILTLSLAILIAIWLAACSSEISTPASTAVPAPTTAPSTPLTSPRPTPAPTTRILPQCLHLRLLRRLLHRRYQLGSLLPRPQPGLYLRLRRRQFLSLRLLLPQQFHPRRNLRQWSLLRLRRQPPCRHLPRTRYLWHWRTFPASSTRPTSVGRVRWRV